MLNISEFYRADYWRCMADISLSQSHAEKCRRKKSILLSVASKYERLAAICDEDDALKACNPNLLALPSRADNSLQEKDSGRE